MGQDDDLTRRTFRLTAVGAWLALLMGLAQLAAYLFSGFVIMQPNFPPLPADQFEPAAGTPLALWNFAADTLFILGYLAMFIGLYVATAGRARVLPGFALGAGLLSGLLDAVENTFFITNAALAAQHQPLIATTLPLLYIVGGLKFMLGLAAAFAFGLALAPLWASGSAQPAPGYARLEQVVAGLLLLLPPVGALSIALIVSLPLVATIGIVIFILLAPVSALYFQQRAA